MKEKIKIEIEKRINGKYFSFEINPSIEEYFKIQTNKTKESKDWGDLNFYDLLDLTNDEFYQNLLSEYNLFDDFGGLLFKDGKFNVAFIKTVGGKGRIEINDDISLDIISEGINNINHFLTKYYQDFIQDYKIKEAINGKKEE